MIRLCGTDLKRQICQQAGRLDRLDDPKSLRWLEVAGRLELVGGVLSQSG
jgi:hypothetical protein